MRRLVSPIASTCDRLLGLVVGYFMFTLVQTCIYIYIYMISIIILLINEIYSFSILDSVIVSEKHLQVLSDKEARLELNWYRKR